MANNKKHTNAYDLVDSWKKKRGDNSSRDAYDVVREWGYDYGTKEESVVRGYNERAEKYNSDLNSYMTGGNVSGTSLGYQEEALRNYLDANKRYLGAGNEARSYLDEAQKARCDYDKYSRTLGYADKYKDTTHAERQTALDTLRGSISPLVSWDAKRGIILNDIDRNTIEELDYLQKYDEYATSPVEAAEARAAEDAERVKRMEELRAQGAEDSSPLTDRLKNIAKIVGSHFAPGTSDLYDVAAQAAESDVQTEYNKLYAEHLNYVRNQQPADQAIGAYYDTTDYDMLAKAQAEGDFSKWEEATKPKAKDFLYTAALKAIEGNVGTKHGGFTDADGNGVVSTGTHETDRNIVASDSDAENKTTFENLPLSSNTALNNLKEKHPEVYDSVKDTIYHGLYGSTDEGSTQAKYGDYIEPEEWAVFYALIGEGNPASESQAISYLNGLKYKLAYRAEQADTKATEAAIKREPGLGIASTFGAIGGKIIGSVPAAADELYQVFKSGITGEKFDYDPHTVVSGLNTAADISQQATSEAVREWGGDIPAFLYNVGVSTASSVLGAKGFGKAYTFIMGSGAAATRARELYERGVNGNELFTASLAAGINEALFEYVSLDKLLKIEPHTKKELLRDVLQQAGIEGSEELFTDIANNLSDIFTLGQDSDINAAIRDMMANDPSMSYEEARQKAYDDAVQQVVMSGLAGALSGGVSAVAYAAPTIASAVRTDRVSGENIASHKGGADYFVQQGLQQPENSDTYKIAKKIQERSNKGKAISNYQLGSLGWALTEQQANLSQEKRSEYRAYMNSVGNEQAVVEALVEKGMSEDKAQEVAPAVTKLINGKDTNRAEIRSVENDETASAYVEEVQQEQARIMNEALGADFNAEMYQGVLTERGEGDTKAQLTRTAETVTPLPKANLGEASIREANTVRKGTRISEDNTARDSQGNEIDLGNSKVVSIENGVATIELNDGNKTQVKSSDIAYANNDQAVIYETLANVEGMTPENMNFFVAMRKSVDTDVNAGVWAQGIAEGYNLGYTFADNQRGLAKAEQSARYLSNISNDMRLKAEEYGKEAARQSRKTTAQTTLRDERNIKKGESTEEQHKRVQDLAKRLGLEIVYDDTIKGDGEYVHGKQVVLRHDTADPVAFVLKHELTHFAESSKDYAAFADAVVKSKAFEAWIAEQTTRSDKTSERKAEYLVELKNRYNRHGVKLSYSAAQREMIANFVGDMLFNENGRGIEGMTRGMNTADRNAVIKFLDKLISWFKKHFGGDVAEIKALEQMFNKALSTSEGKQSGEAQESISDRQDADYLSAVESGDMKTAQRMVDEAAKAAGYDSPMLYHGTEAFGFTVADTSKSDDNISFFATDSEDVAKTYSWDVGRRDIGQYNIDKKTYEENIDKLYDEMIRTPSTIGTALDHVAGQYWANYKELSNYIDELSEKTDWIDNIESEWEVRDYFESLLDDLYDATSEYYDDSDEFYLSDEVRRYREAVDESLNIVRQFVKTRELENPMGIYALYANTAALLELDGDGANWSRVPLGDNKEAFNKWAEEKSKDSNYALSKGYATADRATTRVIARFAKDAGFNGVKFNAIHDSGGRGNTIPSASTIYVFFNPQQQIKSADPVTYDDNGNVIPLSERFNPANEDIRYSIPDRTEKAEANNAERQIKKLNDAVKNLKDMLKLQRTETHGLIADKASVERAAVALMKKWNIKSGKAQFVKELSELFTNLKKLSNKKTMTFAEIQDAAKPLVDRIANAQDYTEEIPGVEEALNMVKGAKIKLRDVDRKAIKENDQTVNEWKHAAGTIVLDNVKGTPFDIIWADWADGAPGWFKRDVDEAEMALEFARVIKQLKENKRVPMQYADEMYDADREKALLDVMRAIPDIVPLETFADTKAKEIQALKQNFRTTLKELRAEKDAQIRELRKRVPKAKENGYVSPAVTPKMSEERQEEWRGKIDEYGAFPSGEANMTGIRTPQQVNDETRVHRFTRTFLEDGRITDEMIEKDAENILNNMRSYDVVSDKSAEAHVQGLSKEQAEKEWYAVVGKDSDQITKYDVATAEMLIRQAVEEGNAAKALDIEAELSRMLTRSGQVIQAARLFKRMTPWGQLLTLQKTVQKMNQEFIEKYGAKGQKVHINQYMAELLLMAENQTEQEEIVNEINKNVASQIKSSWIDKWNAWRYMSMLTNPKTHIRNLVGNAAFVAPVYLKDSLAAIGEIAFIRDRGKRTKSIVIKPEYRQYARNLRKADSAVKKALEMGGWGNFTDAIQRNIDPFRTKPLNALYKGNTWLLENEDILFKNIHFTHALAGYLQANKVNLKNVDPLILHKGIDYAVKQAFKNTYNDVNAFSSALTRFSKKHKVMGAVVDSVLPFKKTPVNIVARGMQYSPAGLLFEVGKGVRSAYQTKQMQKKLQNGEIKKSEYNRWFAKHGFEAAKFIDGLASGLTGTGIFILGVVLRNLGVLRGRFRDDRDKYEKNVGRQEYAFELFGGSYTIDWLAPINMPLFMGTELADMWGEENDTPLGLSTLTVPTLQAFQPIVQLSMLEGVQDAINAARYSEENEAVGDILTTMASSYFGQVMPTLGGAIKRIIDDTQRQNYYSNNSNTDNFVQKMWNNVRAKTPIGDTRAPYIDLWGQEKTAGGVAERLIENLISPGYWNDIEYGDLDKEVLRLYDNTGDKNVFPKKASKYIENGIQQDDNNNNVIDKNEKKTKYLDEWEYCEYATKLGTYRRVYLSDLLTNETYKTLDEDTQAEIVKDIYSYANAKAKTDVSDYDISAINTYKTAHDFEKNGGNLASFYVNKYAPKQNAVSVDDLLSQKDHTEYISQIKDMKNAGQDIQQSVRDTFKQAYHDGDDKTRKAIAELIKEIDDEVDVYKKDIDAVLKKWQ